jgi:hypothetical protein
VRRSSGCGSLDALASKLAQERFQYSRGAKCRRAVGFGPADREIDWISAPAA